VDTDDVRNRIDRWDLAPAVGQYRCERGHVHGQHQPVGFVPVQRRRRGEVLGIGYLQQFGEPVAGSGEQSAAGADGLSLQRLQVPTAADVVMVNLSRPLPPVTEETSWHTKKSSSTTPGSPAPR
jgi:hypothetical protein